MGEKMRIYVGGLGASVQEDDLRKTFTSPHLGAVESVEIVRSKGRSFAYMEFVPASEKGLAKLFSAYNGCMWRGGKLKLEKAKEHYLLRLKREWTEDAELATVVASQNIDTDDKMHTSHKSKEDVEKMQLNIFFPRLRKIKSVPFKGTGKHKYSFQRVEVPSLPIHFCDCEEHAGPPDQAVQAKTNYANEPEIAIGGINEEELNMMRSVLDKIFKEDNSNKPSDDTKFAYEKGISVPEVDNLEVGDNDEDYISDDDNLLINVVTKPSSRVVLSEDKSQKRTGNQNTLFGEPESFSSRPTNGAIGSQKNIQHNKKRKVSFHEHEPEKKIKPSNDESARRENNTNDIMIVPPKIRENDEMPPKRKEKKEAPHGSMRDLTGPAQLNRDTPQLQKSEWKNLVGEKGRTAFHISDILADRTLEFETKSQSEFLSAPSALEKDSQDLPLTKVKELVNVSPVKSTEPSALEAKPDKGASWSQKASWLKLVGGTSSSSFSLAQVVPEVALASEKQRLQQSDAKVPNLKVGNQHSFALEDDKSPTGIMNGSAQISNTNASVKVQDCAVVDGEKQTSDAKQGVELEASTSLPLSSEAPGNNAHVREITISETCPFMRSASSMKEWTKMKTALSASLKKKGKEKEPGRD